MLRAYCKHRNDFNRYRFKRACREYTKLNRVLYYRYIARTERKLRSNPNQFWNYVNSKRKEDGLPVSVYLAEEEASTCASKCTLFSNHFKSVFSCDKLSPEAIATALENVPQDRFDTDIFTVSNSDIEKAASQMKPSFNPGPDGIPSVLLKRCCQALKSPLSRILNLSLETSSFPTRWKYSFMFPVFKKGCKRNVENYRGITSLSACSKLFEKIIHEHLLFRVKNYISTSQHGFFPGRSVSTNLLEFTSCCLCAIEKQYQIDTIYTDFKAAFDRVDQELLLAKMERLGVSNRLTSWFRSYLCNRKMAVKLGGTCSEWFGNGSGVPQGSTLGPLLFSIFVNDITLLIPAGARLLYADDLKIFILVNCIDDCLRLQSLINLFVDWCRKNKMTLSVQKCSVISFHRKKSPLHFQYTINGQTLQRCDCVKDLGVLLDTKLTFTQHYLTIINKANRQLGMIMKIGANFRDPYTLRALYCSLVRSILEAGAVVWDPHYAVWTSRIERIQKVFIRRALRHLPWRDPDSLPRYEDRCRLLGLDTLEQRRKMLKATTAFKILTASYDSPFLLAQLQLYCPQRPQRHYNLLRLRQHRTNYGQHEPVRDMAMEFNRRCDIFNF